MSEDAFPPEPPAPVPPATPGAELRAMREAHGLSVDDVAQQLKLAPRQVQALEDDDYARLPGRTFVRGFVRNYARYIGLDPDALVARLPDATVAPALERPTLPPSGRPMGELRMQTAPRRGWGRVLIPLVLIAIVVAAGYYEYRREQAESRQGERRAISAPAGSTAVAPLPLPSGAAPVGEGTAPSNTPAPGAANGATNVPRAGATGASMAAPNAQPGAALPGGTALPTGAGPAAGTGDARSAAGSGTGGTPGDVAATTPGGPTGASGATAAAAAGPVLLLAFKGNSWAQVRDRDGKVVLTYNGVPGSTQSVSAAPPLEVVLGNASAVTVSYGGRPVDIAAFVRGDVARFQLK